MAKKKVNKLVVAAITTVLVGGAGAGAAYYIVLNKVRPSQNRAAAEAAMKQGDYKLAFEKFGRAMRVYSTDIEFNREFYEALNHLTSFDEENFRGALNRLDQMLIIRPSDAKTLHERLRVDVEALETMGSSVTDLDTMADQAKTLLTEDPNDPVATRAALMAQVLQQGTATSTADAQALSDQLKSQADADPMNPDKFTYYAVANAQRRLNMVRDRAIADGPDTDVAKAIFADLNGRAAAIFAAAGGEPTTQPAPVADAAAPSTQPAYDAEARARMYRAVSQIDKLLVQARLVPRDQYALVRRRQLASIVAAANTMPLDVPIYVITRMSAASMLEEAGQFADAEKMYRSTIDARPELWTPRMELAEFLARQGRPAEALATLDTKLEPSFKLTGLEGHDFVTDSIAVPIRRCVFRIQALGAATSRRGAAAATQQAVDAAGEIAKAQADYDLAIGAKVSAEDPRALQAKSALQEANGDRAAAAETLRHATEVGNVDPGQMRAMMRHLVDLNVAVNQPGRAADVLERLVQSEGQLQDILQLLDLRIRNNQVAQANQLVAQLQQMLPNNPVVALAQAKLGATPQQVRDALAKVPEDNPQLMSAKFQIALSTGNKDQAREIAKRGLAVHPDNLGLAAQYIDMLVADNDRDEAMKVIDAAIAKQPDNVALRTIRDSITATGPDRTAVIRRTFNDPYQLALFDAAQLRGKDDEAYIAKLREAVSLDSKKDGAAAEQLFRFLLSKGRNDEAEPLLATLGQSHMDPAAVRANQARLLLARGKADEAIVAADALVRDLPDFSTGWVVKGEAHELLGQNDQAANSFDTALQFRPDDTEALRGAIDTAERLGRGERMRRFVEQALRAVPNDPYFVSRQQDYEIRFGDATQTIQPRLAARDAHPDQPNTWLALAQSYTAAYLERQKANDAAGAEDYRKKAFDLLTQAMAKFPKASGFPIQAAELATAGSDVAGATKLIDGMEQTPAFRDDPQVQLYRANFYVDHGQAPKGRQMLETIVAGNQGGEYARMKLADVQAQAGDLEAALRTLVSAPTQSSQLISARFNLLLGANRVDEAQQLADSMIAQQRSVQNLMLDAIAHAAKKDLPAAVKLADEAVNLAPDNADTHLTRARIALQERPIRNNDVIADLEAVKKAVPGNAQARLMLADRYKAVGRSTDALGELEAVQNEQPGNKDVVQKLVSAYLTERPVRFERIYNVVAAAKGAGLGTDAQILSLESDVALQAGDYARAIKDAAEAVKNGGQDPDLYRKLLTALVKGGQYSQVLTELDRIQGINSSLYWTYLSRGVALHRLNRETEAAPQFDRALSIATSLRDNAPPLTEIAGTYAGEYGADKAADWLDQKLPGNPEAQALSVSLYTREAKFDKAVAAGTRMMASLDQLNPGRQAAALSDLGTACLASTPPQPKLARDAFEHLLKVTPDDVLALNNLAYTLTLDGSGGTLDQAADVAKRAYDLSVQSGTENPYIMDTYGWTLVQAGKAQDGLDILRRAQTIKRLPEIEYHIGSTLLTQGDKDGALQSFRNAVALIAQAKQNNEAVDASLEPKIQEGMAKAQQP